jgi:multidrug resistance efflux pump
LEQGIVPPEIQQLKVERQRFQQQLEEVATNVARFEKLHQDEAVSRLRVEEQQSLYRNVQRDLDVNAERIELVQRQLREETTRELGNVSYQVASVKASQMILEGNRQMSAQKQAIATLEAHLQQLQSQRQALTLTATTSGTVITSDLDLLIGKEVRPENALLQIADLGQLTANVEIKEEDLTFVQKGAPVTFRPRQAKLESYDARVDDILYNVEVDETQQKRVATVRVIIDNPKEQLRPGSSGYAKIFSEWMPLYERVGREVLKLIPERFF